MNDPMTFTDDLLAALKSLLWEFDDGEGGTDLHMATITPERLAEIEALIARGGGS